MSYKADPIRKARAPFEKLLIKGHLFAVIQRNTGKVIESSRRADVLKPFYMWRSDCELVDLKKRLAEMPEPIPAAPRIAH